MRRINRTGSKAACQVLLIHRGQGKQNMDLSPSTICQSMLPYLFSSVRVAMGVSGWPRTARGVTEDILKILQLLAIERGAGKEHCLLGYEPFFTYSS